MDWTRQAIMDGARQGGGEPPLAAWPAPGMPPAWAYRARRAGLWVFLGVITSLFMLFGAAYVMRMAAADWQPLRYIPWQLWCSTALLALACLAWETARRRAQSQSGRRAALAGCALSLAFLGAQWWAWQAMMAMRYRVDGNPADSFFFMLTGLHGAHVLGGLVAAALAGVLLVRGAAGDGPARQRLAGSIALCAQYWHYLLGLWLFLFGLLFWVTPDVVQAVCEGIGIRPVQAR